MSYGTIGKIATSQGFNKRVSASAAQELPDDQNVTNWVFTNVYRIAAAPGFDAAWESAEASATDNTNPDIGARDDVITDGMILSAVQGLIAAQFPPA